MSTAPEIRIDQLTGLRTLLAPGRAERPGAPAAGHRESVGDAAETCPLCEGREARTPPEVWANRPGGGAADSPGWQQRSAPNLYPALVPADGPAGIDGPLASGLSSSADPLAGSTRANDPDLFKKTSAEGVHEVIANVPRHATALAELDDAELAGAMAAWRERMGAHAEESSCVHLIVNEGPSGGGSLEHSHAQLFALPFVPAEIARERERHTAYNQRTMGGHLLEDVMVEEVRRRERLVAIDGEATLFCPWASRSPYELRLVPRTAEARFDRDDRGAELLGRGLRALVALFPGGVGLNLWIRSAPRGTEEFHWHLDLVPRLSTRAGFELGTGVDINTYPPERAAADLREVLAG